MFRIEMRPNAQYKSDCKKTNGCGRLGWTRGNAKGHYSQYHDNKFLERQGIVWSLQEFATQ